LSWLEKLTSWSIPEVFRTHGVGVKSAEIMGNTKGEGITLGYC